MHKKHLNTHSNIKYMWDLIFWIIVFLASLALLIKSSDFFTDSAEKIGIYFGMPAFIVGVTIVAVGTSLPELVSSVIAVLEGSSEIVIGNVVGSNITNIFLVLGIVAIAAKTINIKHNLISIDMPIFIASALMLFVVLIDGVFSLHEAILFVVGIIIYIAYGINAESNPKKEKTKKKINKTNKSKKEIKEVKPKIRVSTWIILLTSAFFIYVGAKFTVDSVIQLATILNVGAEVLAVTAIALGTSLPELTVSITAIKKKKTEMAIGNLLGSNIFNAFAVMGVAGLFGNLIIPQSILVSSIPFMLAATFLYFFITVDKKISKWEGMILLLFYVLFFITTILSV